MKKEARLQAQRMFVKADGRITNREIAKAVNVNALTIGRWKKDDNWEEKLSPSAEGLGKGIHGIIRKKAARDQAFQEYLDKNGNITNKDLARLVGVSPATISKWKEVDSWIEKLQDDEGDTGAKNLAQAPHELDIGELVSPEQIIQINRLIDTFLDREYLSASEIADLAEAKSDLLEAVEIYLGIVREMGELQFDQAQ